MFLRTRVAAFLLSFCAGAALCPALAEAQTARVPNGHVVLVLPFENKSGNASLNWIGDSFPDTLDRRLNTSGFLTISRNDRLFAYDHLALPKDFRPSRATTIQIARRLDANYVVIGSYSVANNRISVQAHTVDIDDLRLSSQIEDSADLPRLFDAENAIAWKVARSIDPHFTVAESTFIAAPGAVPLPAFEDYIRGGDASSSAERIERLKAAVAVSPGYAAALLELGKEQYLQRNYPDASQTLSKVPQDSPLALEGGFYLGLSRFNSANYSGAEQAFAFVASRLPLPEVVNDEGVALSRQNKDAVPLFQRALAADPSDEDYHYNLALAFYRRGDIADALSAVADAVKLKPKDNEAIELQRQLKAAVPGSKLPVSDTQGFGPVERVRRTYSETSYRQAAYQLAQLRAAHMATLPLSEQASEYTALGEDALKQGFTPQAEADFQSALKAEPTNAAAHAGLAEVREHTNDPTQARAEAKSSLRSRPNAPALLVLARLDMVQNALPIAADEVSQALSLDPQNIDGLSLKQALQARGQAVR